MNQPLTSAEALSDPALNRELVQIQLDEAIEACGKTTSRKILDALHAAREVLAEPTSSSGPATSKLLCDCVAKLEAAVAIRISHTDSDSRVEQLNGQRTQAMREVLAELKTLV